MHIERTNHIEMSGEYKTVYFQIHLFLKLGISHIQKSWTTIVNAVPLLEPP